MRQGQAGDARKRRSHAEVARARKLQGQYLGALKSLKGRGPGQGEKDCSREGVAEAVKLAQSAEEVEVETLRSPAVHQILARARLRLSCGIGVVSLRRPPSSL